ncbi:MAG: hypothetical protein KKA42_07780, partial [candidate division Zixibacteria bacterium]|nr:hypothetical protein [candidate division Zixibacteria bacterium]
MSFKDVLTVPASALSAKQILVMSLALVAAFLVYDLFAYLALAVQGNDLGVSFRAYGFFPFDQVVITSRAARIVFWLGGAASVLVVMLGFLAVSIINIEAIRGNRFMSPREAIRFALKRLPQVLMAELSIGLFVLFIVVLMFLLGLVSRIPVVGEWLYVILFALPNFVIAILSVFIIFVFTLTVLLLPAVAAADRRGETFSAILETFSTIILQPVRWAGYTVYSIVAAKVCGFVFAYFTFRAVQFLTWSTSLGGGERLTRLVKSGLAHLPVNADIVRETFNLLPG